MMKLLGVRAELSHYKVVFIKTDDIYKEISEDAETRIETSNYEWESSLPKEKNKKNY